LNSRVIHIAKSVDDALQIACQVKQPDGLILVTGSLYLVGAVQETYVAVRRSAH
jgi:folylpolyglutamate synthase/dihydropteroate synthase